MAEQTQPDSIDYFSSGHPLRGLATKVALRARTAMYDDFMTWAMPTPSDRIIDVGVTPDRELADSNFFERLYPHPAQITATSIEDVSFLEADHPGLRFVQTDGNALPFEDGAFDVAFCSAVLEHVGGEAAQRQFLAELARVARRFYVTTPNRWFPVEVHTFLPLLHWLPKRVHRRLLGLLRMPFWADEANLNLVGADQLRGLFPEGATVEVKRRRLLGFTSNLVARGGTFT
jgi:SAM-dependent methyltransferase